MIRGQMFSKSVAAPGQIVFYHQTFGAARTVTLVVPPGVTSISAVVVQSPASGIHTEILRGTTALLGSGMALGVNGVWGGNGGAAGASGQRGGGGAGGYSGTGGAGGGMGESIGGYYSGAAGAPGQGGGGGGGGSGWTSSRVPSGTGGAFGGGVGLLGTGNNGSAGSGGYSPSTDPTAGGNGSQSTGSGAYGGGAGYRSSSGTYSPGGNLRYKNDIPVTPGETLTIKIGAKAPDASTWNPGNGGAVRIMWGGGRSYPSNAGDV